MGATVELRNGDARRVVEVRQCGGSVSYYDPETGYDYTPYVWGRMGWYPTTARRRRDGEGPWCVECSGPYPLETWPGSQYGGHWDTCPNRHKEVRW